MYKNIFLLSVTLVSSTLFVSNFAFAEVTVTQVGSDLYIVGGDGNDSVYVSQFWNSNYVYVYDLDTDIDGFYYEVDKVFVDTGNGDDLAWILDFYSAYNGLYNNAEIRVDTGNGSDYVRLEAFAPKSLEVNTGNENDSLLLLSENGVHWGGSISINTGNGEDQCEINSYGDNINVDLGNGKDKLTGWSWNASYYGIEYSNGTLDGANGKDNCSGFYDFFGTLNIVNCED